MRRSGQFSYLRVPALDGFEVKIGTFGIPDPRRRCSASITNAMGRSSNFNGLHFRFWPALGSVTACPTPADNMMGLTHSDHLPSKLVAIVGRPIA
jgi:hypothetical protein